MSWRVMVDKTNRNSFNMCKYFVSFGIREDDKKEKEKKKGKKRKNDRDKR